MNRTELSNRMGQVRVAIIGSSNSGKSTLVNALCHRFLLPEASCTSTWLTTYLGRVPLPKFECGVMNRRGTLHAYNYDEFRQMFVYNYKTIYDGEKSKGCNLFGFVHTENLFTKHGIILIDTIGAGINQYDTKRSAAIAQKADIVVFVYDASRSANFTLGETEFLKQTLFQSKRRSVKFCQRIIFVPNKIDNVSSVTEVCRTLKYNLKIFFNQETEGYKCIINNIIPVSALYGRLKTVGLLPIPSREDYCDEDSYMEALQRRKYEAEVMKTQDLLPESNLTTLAKAILKVSKAIKKNKKYV